MHDMTVGVSLPRRFIFDDTTPVFKTATNALSRSYNIGGRTLAAVEQKKYDLLSR